MKINHLNELCRFCLSKDDTMQYLPVSTISESNIARLYEIVTSIKV